MKEEKTKKFKNQINTKILIVALITYVTSSLVSFLVFGNIQGNLMPSPVAQPKKTTTGKLLFDPTLPKTEPCPLNGAKYSVQQRDWWEKHSPLGIMIENHLESRPQSGLTSADIIYEAIAEGGITRFLAIYYCQDAEVVGPVRSARTYFLDLISEYGKFPLYAHVGGANTPGPANALGQISDYGWSGYNDLNQFSIGFPVFIRDYDRLGRTVATEHTVYSSTTKLWDYAKKSRKITNTHEEKEEWNKAYTPYKIKEESSLQTRPESQNVEYNFWTGYDDYKVTWAYDKATNSYKRMNGGKVHTDLNNKQQVISKNVVVLLMRESRANDGYEGNLHLIYGTKGTGNALVYQDGEEIEATWSKKNRTSHLFLRNKRGQDIEFNPGMIWFSIVSSDTEVAVK